MDTGQQFWLALAIAVATAIVGVAVTVGGFQSKRAGRVLLAACPIPLLVFLAATYERFFWPSSTGIVLCLLIGVWPARRQQTSDVPSTAAPLPRVILHGADAFHVKRIRWQGELDVLGMRLINAPLLPSESAVAKDVSVTFTCEGPGVALPWLDARFDSSPEPPELGPGQRPTLSYDIGIDKWKEVNLIVKRPGDDDCYLFNNDSYLYPAALIPAWRIGPGEYRLVAKASGVGVREQFESTFLNPGAGSALIVNESDDERAARLANAKVQSLRHAEPDKSSPALTEAQGEMRRVSDGMGRLVENYVTSERRKVLSYLDMVAPEPAPVAPAAKLAISAFPSPMGHCWPNLHTAGARLVAGSAGRRFVVLRVSNESGKPLSGVLAKLRFGDDREESEALWSESAGPDDFLGDGSRTANLGVEDPRLLFVAQCMVSERLILRLERGQPAYSIPFRSTSSEFEGVRYFGRGGFDATIGSEAELAVRFVAEGLNQMQRYWIAFVDNEPRITAI